MTKKEALQSIYQQIANKCYRSNLVEEEPSLDEWFESEEDLTKISSELDNHLANLITPAVEKLNNRSLYDLYELLYRIDVDESFIKEKIMELNNTALIPSVISFAIIDRLKERYFSHLSQQLEGSEYARLFPPVQSR